MVPRHDPHEIPEVEAVFPRRPPQYKRSTCGFDCGLGCDDSRDEDSSDGRSDADTESTKVDVSVPETTAGQHSHDDLTSMETSRLSIVPMPTVEELERDAGLTALAPRPEEVMRAWDGLVERLRSSVERDISRSTMDAAERVQDSPSMGRARLRIMSPGPGIGDWDARIKPLPRNYFFHGMPLRLSPQFEHCRGNPFFHMVGQDAGSLMDLMDLIDVLGGTSR